MINEVYKKNLEYLRGKRNDLNALSSSIYKEIACEIFKDKDFVFSADEISMVYEELNGSDTVTPSGDFALFCKALSDTSGNLITQPFVDQEFDTFEEVLHTQISYLKNAFSDRAYRKFATTFDKVSASYMPGFREVCEDVFYGRCSHAILPIYSSTDGQLLSFRRLISKYDLKIVCVTDIEMSDESVMRYALLKKRLTGTAVDGERSFLDISVVIGDGFDCGKFLASCESLGVHIQSAASYPLEYAGDTTLLTIVFDITNADITALYLFHECSHLRYTVNGIYKLI